MSDCNPKDWSPPGSSVHGISQATILEWLPFPPPRDLSNPGIKPPSPALQADSLPLSHQGSHRLNSGFQRYPPSDPWSLRTLGLCGKRDFADMIKSRFLRWRDKPAPSTIRVDPMPITRVLIRRKQDLPWWSSGSDHTSSGGGPGSILGQGTRSHMPQGVTKKLITFSKEERGKQREI